MPLAPRTTSAVTRARVLHLGLNVLTGILSTSWLARIPAIRDSLGLTTADIGMLLLVGSLASLATVMLTPRAVRLLGNRGVLAASGVVLGVGSALMGIGPQVGSVPLLAAGLLLNGAGSAVTSVVFNVENARIERAVGRTVIPQFHAAFSLGAVAGSVVGALASRAGVPVGVQLAAVGVVTVVWRFASLDAVLPPQPDELAARPVVWPAAGDARPTARPRRRPSATAGPWLERRTLLIAAMVFAGSLSEGSANNWLSLAVVDGFDRPEATGGVVLGVFVGAMTVCRALGTRLIDRFGRRAVLRASGLAAIAGLLVFGLAPGLPFAVLGVALWGAGAAMVAPIGMGASADDPLRAAGRVAVATAGGAIAAIIAPPALGLVAQTLGARGALMLVAVPLVTIVALAGAVRRAPGEETAPIPSDEAGPAAAAPAGVATAPTAPRGAPFPDQLALVGDPTSRSGVDVVRRVVAASTPWRPRR